MKEIRLKFLLGLVLFGLPLIHSCSDDNDYDELYANALVTVKPLDNGNDFFLQLDENTALKPVNMSKAPYGNKQVRALVNYEDIDDADDLNGFDPNSRFKPVELNWIDSIRTKEIVHTLGEIDNIKEYGNDPLDIVRDWVTIAEDGYLTLRFRTFWGYTNIKHSLNLIYGENPNDPYEVILHHNNNGDFNERVADGIIAFDLSKLPDTNGEYVNLTLKWNSIAHRGYKSIVFKYKTRSTINTNSGTTLANIKYEVKVE